MLDQQQKIDKMVNFIMKDGKKSIAKKIYSEMLQEIKASGHMNPAIVVETAIENISPVIMVKSKRLGGSVYQVPVEVKAGRSTTLALRWLIEFSRARREKSMAERLTNELIDASNGLGAAVKRREDTHKMAEANKAFAHYRW